MKLPAFASSPATLAFHGQLVDEHLDEAAFLYEQRRARLDEPQRPWAELAGIEQRIEAHLDALAVAGRHVLAACIDRAEAEPGTGAGFVAAAVCCRRRDQERFLLLLDAMKGADEPGLMPLRDALRVELPDEWQAQLLALLSAGRPAWVALYADICRPTWDAAADVLLSALQRRIATRPVVRALGRLKPVSAQAALWACLDEQDPGTRSDALVALLQLGDREAASLAAGLAPTQPWARHAVGVSGNRAASDALRQRAIAGAADGADLEALGRLGDPQSIAALLDALTQDARAPAAAQALHQITGAALFEEVFVGDPVDEAALGAVELAAFKERGEQPLRIDGQPFGEKRRQLTQVPQRWQRWLAEHGADLRPGARHRGARLCDASDAVRFLADPYAGLQARRLAMLELGIRFACPVPLDDRLPVGMQQALLADAARWAGLQGSRLPPGAWTFAGRTE